MNIKPQSDDKYQKLMEAYKALRRNPEKRERALMYLRDAQELDRLGEVSPDVVTAWQYLG